MNYSRKLYPLAASLLGISCAHAQQPILEEVLVVAQKREQNLQVVPVAVSAFSADMIVKSGVQDMVDLSANAPSLIVDQVQTSTATSFGIRGVFTSSQNFGLESSVGLYVDGVYRARQGSMINNLIDIEGVEVLRGPQGTLFGRNTPSGAVSILSVEPDHEGTGYLEAAAGNYDLLSVSGAKSVSVIDEELALRATGFYMERDGYVDIIGQGDDIINDRDRWGVRLQALYTPTLDLSVRVIADHSEVDESCCAAGSWKNNFFAQDLPPGAPPRPGSDTRVVQELGGTVVDEKDFYHYRASLSFAPESSNEDQGLSVQVDWQTENFLLTSITAWRSHDSSDRADADFSDVDGVNRINDAEQEQFTQELRFSDEGENYAYVAGLYYYQQTLDSVTDTLVGEDLAVLVNADFLPDAFPGGTGSRNIAEQEHQSYALFGQADYNLTADLLLTAGLRWTKEDKELKNFFTEDASEFPPGVPPCLCFEPGWGFWLFPPLAPRDDVDENIDDDQVTGTVKLSWFMNEETMFYASYGTGYKAGGVNTDRITEGLDVVFDAETSEAFEVGVKADFPAQALRLNLALHRTDTDDLQTISFQGTGFALQNAGVAETWGGELDLFWQPLERTRLTLAYAYNHAEYAEFEKGDCWVGTPWHKGAANPGDGEFDPGNNGDGSCDRSGGMVSSNPENVLVLTGNQEFRLGSDITGFLYGEYIYTDERMTDVNNDPVKLDGAYDVVNLRAGVMFERWDLTLTLWGRNVFDEDSTNTIADAPGQDGRFIGYYKDPLTWGFTARKEF